MDKKIKVILNPYAGRWNALQRKAETEKALFEAGVKYDLVTSEFIGHGYQLASQAVLEGYDTIVSAGGDGSIHEVINGMLQTESGRNEIPKFGVLPLGTANDLAVNLKIPVDISSAAKTIAQDNEVWMDLGHVTFELDGKKMTQYFDNNSAVGLEPTITFIQEKIQVIKGVPRYIISALIGIMRNPQWSMKIEWEGGNYYGPVTLVTVGNHPLTGGVFYMTPNANGFDGLLTFVYGSIQSKLKILSILPKAMKNGPDSYVNQDGIHQINSPWIRISSDQPTPLHTDGEIQAESVYQVEYRIMPRAIPVLVPQSFQG